MIDPKELHAALSAITRARDATYNVITQVLDVTTERLMAELRLDENDREEQIKRLRHTIGCAVLALQSLAEGIRVAREFNTNESNEVH